MEFFQKFLSRIFSSSKAPAKARLHFLHIGKTGGTAIKHVLSQYPDLPEYLVALHPHKIRLRDVPEGEKFMFFLRDPISRFVSGFYSRQRQGRPRYFSRWSPKEEMVFKQFTTPNTLALALSSQDETERAAAEEAMKSIAHVRDSFWDWFEDEEYFLSRRSDLFFIGFQESIAADFDTLKKKLALPAHAELPTDDIAAHKNPEGVDKRLEAEAIANLHAWYQRDDAFINLCRTHFGDLTSATSSEVKSYREMDKGPPLPSEAFLPG